MDRYKEDLEVHLEELGAAKGEILSQAGRSGSILDRRPPCTTWSLTPHTLPPCHTRCHRRDGSGCQGPWAWWSWAGSAGWDYKRSSGIRRWHRSSLNFGTKGKSLLATPLSVLLLLLQVSRNRGPHVGNHTGKGARASVTFGIRFRSYPWGKVRFPIRCVGAVKSREAG
jgi:hypothetical protein